MDFGIFYEIQVSSPLKHREREAQVFHQVLEQVALAEEVGFSNFWSVEHHFQPGFSHCSAPEVLYGALSQRTSKIRIDIRSCCCLSLTKSKAALSWRNGGLAAERLESSERCESRIARPDQSFD